MTTTHSSFDSTNKILESLNEALRILDSAERWGKEDLSSITPFLNIIKGTVNDTKYRLAQITIRSAEEELQSLMDSLSADTLPEELAQNLKNASLPEEIKSKNFFETSLTHEEYEALREQINIVIGYVKKAQPYLSN